MALLTEVQEALLTHGTPLTTTLLKLKFLATRIGSDALEDWVKHELEGYPEGVLVPAYRKAAVSYRGVFVGYVNVMNDVPVSPAVIEKVAGKHWNEIDVRDSMPVVDERVSKTEDGGAFGINTGNLLHLIRDAIYTSHQCTHLTGIVDNAIFVRIQGAVRSKALDLTVELEKKVPEAKEITLREKVGALPPEAVNAANTVTRSVVYNVSGTFNQINASSGITVSTVQGNINQLVNELVSNGLPEADAKELAGIIGDEKPVGKDQPLGKRAAQWIADKAAAGWSVGKEIAVPVAIAAAKKFYGLG